MRSRKLGRPLKGCAGLQVRLIPMTSSAAVTWRGGTVSHCTPCLRVIVYVLPSTLMPPLSVVGTCSARSGTDVVISAGSAGLVNSWRL